MGEVLFLVLRRLRAPLITLIVVYAVSIAGMVAIPGIDPEGRPWRMSIFHALYVMSYTATTIGFGEIPHPFTDAQRLWVMAAIYLSVIGWAYALGSVFALTRDPAFRAAAARSRFHRRVARLREPYCVVCGYGRSGAEIAQALDALGVRVVIVDHDPARLEPVAVRPFVRTPLVLVADARRPEVLRDAGIAKPECRAVLALTGDDEANQSIAIGTRVLDPATRVIARVANPVVHANLAEFGEVRVIDPFRVFAANLELAFVAPEVLQVEEWLTGAPGGQRPEALQLPRGHWVLAGYGRFGRPLARALQRAGQSWQAFDPRFVPPDEAEDRVHACSGSEEGLRECGVARAVGVVAGTDSDTDNLAIAAMARRANPHAVAVVRLNKAYNRALIEATRPLLVFVQSDLMVHEVLQALITPMLERFLARARTDAGTGGTVARRARDALAEAFGSRVPRVWIFECDAHQPGLAQAWADGAPLLLSELLTDPRDPAVRLRAVPLLWVRAATGASAEAVVRSGPPWAMTRWRPGGGRPRGGVLDAPGGSLPAPGADDDLALPPPETALRPGDCVLFAGEPAAEALQRRYLRDPGPIGFVRTGLEPPRGWLFRRLARPGRRAPGL